MDGPTDDPLPSAVDLRIPLSPPLAGGHPVQRRRFGHNRVCGAAGQTDPGRGFPGPEHLAAAALSPFGNAGLHRARVHAVWPGIPDAVDRAAGDSRPATGNVHPLANAADDVLQPPTYRRADVADHARRGADRAGCDRSGVHRLATGADAAGAYRCRHLPRLGAGNLGAAGAALCLALHCATWTRPAPSEPAGAGARRCAQCTGGGGSGQHRCGQGFRAGRI